MTHTASPRRAAPRLLLFWRLPIWFITGICCAVPLGWFLWQIGEFPAAVRFLRFDAFFRGLLLRTVGYNVAAGVFATLLALPAALVLGRGRGIAAVAFWWLLPVSLLLPSIVYSYGWSQLLRLLHVQLEPASTPDVLRCIVSLATWLWPIPAVVIGLSLRRLDAGVQQQALLDGALRRITARQLLGPAIASIACVTILAMQEFAVYEPTGISVVVTEVGQVYVNTSYWMTESNPLGYAAAAAIVTAMPMLLLIAVLGVVAAWGIRQGGMAAGEEVNAGDWPATLNAGWPVTIGAYGVAALTLGLPLAAMLLRLQRPLNPALAWQESGEPIVGSLFYGLLAGIVGFLLASIATVSRGRWSLWVAVATFLTGGLLLAIAFIRLYNRPGLAWVYNAPPIVVMAHVGRFGWIALLAGAATWSRPWRNLRYMAAVDGAGRLAAAARAVWPLAWPILGAAALLVLVLSITEVPATFLIRPLRPPSIVPMLMTWVHNLDNDPMIEASLLLTAVVMALALGVAGLLWIGVRGWRSGMPQTPHDERTEARRHGGTKGDPRRLFVPSCLCAIVPLLSILSGCSDPTKPDEIWLETGTAPGQTVYPRAIAYSKQDDTYFVIDRVARVQHLNREGHYLNGWEMPEHAAGKPVGVTVGPDGNVYVPDTHYHRVMVYSPAGQLVRQWGSLGREDGQFIFPTDVAFDERGNVFVSEYGENDRIQVFDSSGKFLYKFGTFGQGDGQFSRPQSIVIDGGLVYVTDSCNHRLVVFRTDGTFVRNMGGIGSELGQFRFPYGLDLDPDGRLVVCEFGNNRVQRVEKETGKGLQTWGTAGREPGQLAYPWGVAVDRKGRVVAVDAGNNRLQVFEF